MFLTTSDLFASYPVEESEARPPGRRTLTASLPASRAVQRKEVAAPPAAVAPAPPVLDDPCWFATGAPAGVQRQEVPSGKLRLDDGQLPALAEASTRGGGGALPHHDAIQHSFGRHDVSHIEAHTGGAARAAAEVMGAAGFAYGDQVAFAGEPSLHTAAHEAAHVVQQRAGVHLQGGVGQAGDRHEQHADAVADLVVQGRSAEALLDELAGSPAGAAALQQKLMMSTHGGMFDPCKLPRHVISEGSGHFFDTDDQAQYKLTGFVSERVMRLTGPRGEVFYDLDQDRFVVVNGNQLEQQFQHQQQTQLEKVVREHRVIPTYGGQIYDAPPPETTLLGFHYTSQSGGDQMQQHGVRIDKQLNGTYGAVNGINRDGEGFYLTTDGGWPYYSPERDCLRYEVYIDGQALQQLRAIQRNNTGFENVRWWQDDPHLSRFITDCDVIVRHENATDYKFNPHAVKYLALVYKDKKAGNPQIMKERQEMFGSGTPSFLAPKKGVPQELAEEILQVFASTKDNREQQTSLMQEYAKQKGLNWRDIAQFLRDNGLRE